MSKRRMQCGVILPGGTAIEQLELAVLAEQSGWDGVFVWEAAYGVDAWALAGRDRCPDHACPAWHVADAVAVAAALEGRQPGGDARSALAWAGDPHGGAGGLSSDLPLTGEVADIRLRAEMLDEGIDLMRELWAGRLTYHGRHYNLSCEQDDLATVGRPVQERLPIWVVGAWSRPKSMRRVLRCDGVVPQYQSKDGEGTPDDARSMRTWLTEHGARANLDVIAEGETPAADPMAARTHVIPWAEVGCTWWLETRWEMPHHTPDRMAQVRDRIAAGPPGVDAAELTSTADGSPVH